MKLIFFENEVSVLDHSRFNTRFQLKIAVFIELEIIRDFLKEVPNGIASHCDLCGTFVNFAVKVSTILQFPKTELK